MFVGPGKEDFMTIEVFISYSHPIMNRIEEASKLEQRAI
jgi:hypothetical protein